MSTETLTTIEVSAPDERYSLFETGPTLTLHLAAPTVHGTGPCICGFDRFARNIGFSVGGGTTGPGIKHDVCPDCARLADGRSIRGTNAPLFEDVI